MQAKLSEHRVGRITGSRIGAILGLSPFMTRADVLRDMVRQYHGAPSEFAGNIATEYGQLHEAAALLALANHLDQPILPAEFISRGEFGATPDGLIGESHVVEVKSPFSLRKKNPAPFKALDEQPHYKAQIMLQMAVTGRWRGYFAQYVPPFDDTPEQLRVEEVEFSQEWLDSHDTSRKCAEFMEEFASELKNSAHLEPLRKEIQSKNAADLVAEIDRFRAAKKEAEEGEKRALAALVELVGEKDSDIDGRKLTLVERKGSVSYSRVVKEHLSDLDLEPYRGKASFYWRLT